MAGNKQFIEVNARQSTFAVIIGEDNLTENILIDTSLNFTDFSFTNDALRNVT